MRRALALAQSPEAPRGVNPRVGCVIIDKSGTEVGGGFHHGAGTPHAEVEALTVAGERARGGTAVVTLEPCRHQGRTGPCTTALIDAGIARVVFAQADPTDAAGGGAGVLRAAGVAVIGGVCETEAAAVNRLWAHLQRTGRPFVTLKTAASLDGRVADASGGPTRITGADSQAFVHELRSQVDAIAVGASTVCIDNPQLTARNAAGNPLPQQPLRVVLGARELPAGSRVFDATATSLQIRSRDPRRALGQLAELGIQHLLLEGGPRIASAYLEAGVVDEVIWLIAPTVLDAGPVSVSTLIAPQRIDVHDVRAMGDDVAVFGTIRSAT